MRLPRLERPKSPDDGGLHVGMAAMLTRWGRDLDPDDVLPEHPRPQLVRDSYVNLNGPWEHAITGLDADAPQEFDGPILVPFSPEAPLSGVGRQLQPDELLWYRRTVTFPAVQRGQRLLLHFGAVDQTSTVWLNDVEVGGNHGGYLPFTCELTEAVVDGPNTLVVQVRDLSDRRGPSSGKQRLERGGIWYTAQSGIWQTVWAEVVPDLHVEQLVLTPLLEEGAVEVTVRAAGGTARVRVTADGVEVAGADVPVGVPTRLPLIAVRPWSPDDPFLHDVEVSLGEDRVRSYVGIRSVALAPDAYGVPRLHLNGRAYQHVGVLDQGYWPDGLLTPPSDAAMVHDITTAKQLGFTMIRKHVKVEPLRWYHHCDRLGMLVWQDAVNGGDRHLDPVVSWPGRRRGRWLRLDDDRHRLFGRTDPAGRAAFREEVRRTVELLRSATCVAAWVPFNEGWGQFDAAGIARDVRQLDPTRVVDHASGWHDQGAGDVLSVHVYRRAFRVPRRRAGDRRALALTEYGGHDLAVEGHTWGSRPFGYGHHDTERGLLASFTSLHRALAPAVGEGLAATVYTQLCDVEDEVNGLQTYDREVLKLPAEDVRAALDGLRDALPGEGGWGSTDPEGAS